MSIQVQCESCGIRRRVNGRLAGRTIRCPGCDRPLNIPPMVAAESAVDDAEMEASRGAESADAEAESGDSRGGQIEPHNDSTNALGSSPSNALLDTSTATTPRAMTPADTPTETETATASPSPPVHHAEHAPSAFVGEEDDDALPPRKKRDDGELDMTPMVDVTFLLLIFFMVTASFSLQKSIKMPKQNSDLPSMSQDEEESEDLDPIELEIDENGGFLVLTPEGENETPGKHNLINALKAAVGANKDGMRLDIKVHENAKLQMLVDGMDAATIAGFTEIQVAEVDGFD